MRASFIGVLVVLLVAQTAMGYNVFNYIRWGRLVYRAGQRWLQGGETVNQTQTGNRSRVLDPEEVSISDELRKLIYQGTSTTTSTTTTSSSTSSTSTSTTTSTLNLEKLCTNQRLDEGEYLVDCGGVCKNRCRIVTLNYSRWHTVFGYRILCDYILHSNIRNTYRVTIENPEGLGQTRYMEDEDTGYIETLRYTVLGSQGSQVKVKIQQDPDLSNPDYGRIFMLQSSCSQGDYCRRSIYGYDITIQDLQSQRYTVVTPEGIKHRLHLDKNSVASPDRRLGLQLVKKDLGNRYSLIHAYNITKTRVN